MSEPNHQAVAIVERHEAMPQTHPLVLLKQAIDSGKVDTQALEKLMDLSERYEDREGKKAFNRALVDLKKELPAILDRDQAVDFPSRQGGRVQYTHTSLAHAVELITPHLNRFGFSHSWTASTEGGQVNVTCQLTHVQGHTEAMTVGAAPDTSGSKNPGQSVASTMTLLQRHTLLALLGIATRDMRDPTPVESPADQVDTQRSMKALKACIDAGKTKEQAEEQVGKPVAEWTAADIETVRAWIEPPEVTRIRKAATRQELTAIAQELTESNLDKRTEAWVHRAFNARRAELDRMREPGED